MNDHLNPGEFLARWHVRQQANSKRTIRNILQTAFFFQKIMMMVRNVGIKIRPARINHHFPQKAHLGELMQSVIDGRPGNGNLGLVDFLMKALGRHMTIGPLKK